MMYLILVCICSFSFAMLGFIVGYKVCVRVNFGRLHNVLIESQNTLNKVHKSIKKIKERRVVQ